MDAGKGALLSLTNAHRHLHAADVLGDEGLFGSASAHVILALEELAKSWALTLMFIGFDLPKRMLADVLKRHDVRHSITFGFLFNAMIQGLRARAEVRVQKRHRVKNFPPELRDEFVTELKLEFKSLGSGHRGENPLIILIEWTGGASDLKNQGLYVDFDGERWTHPRRITQKRFAAGFVLASMLIKRLGKTIREAHKTGFQLDDDLKESLTREMARKRPSDAGEILEDLTKMALLV